MRYPLWPLLLLTACAPVGLDKVHDTYVGSFDVTIQDASSGFDHTVFDDSLQLAASRLSAIYPERRVELQLANITVTVQDSVIPCKDSPTGKCKGHDERDDIVLSLHWSDGCAANTSLAHELSHAMRWAFEGFSDPDHYDTRFFDDHCLDDACRTKAVEHAKAEGREEFCR